MTSHDHPLFQRYPLSGTAATSAGELPMPYHIYDGYGLFIGGTADLEAVRRLLQPEQVQPARTRAGRALMGVWICDFTQASLGPHHELQFSIFVVRGEAAPVPDQPLGLLAAMLGRPDVQMLCHGLWNNTPPVVAYNREVLGLNARLSDSRIESQTGRLSYLIREQVTGAPLLEGAFHRPGQASLRAGFDLSGLLGFGRVLDIGRQPWVRMEIVNPVGAGLARSAVAEAFTKNEVNAVRYWDARTDSLALGDTLYARLGFQPLFGQYMHGFKFVYLNPH